MAKRVFFSFHYQDVVDFRANVVRMHSTTKPEREDIGFFDASLWEETKRSGKVALKRLINSGLDNTSVTCVLVGSETYARPWVRYELLKSYKKGNKLLACHINSVKGRDERVKPPGPNPLDFIGVVFSSDGRTATLKEYTNGVWSDYIEIDGSANYDFYVEEQFRGKGFKLSSWYGAYDWIIQDGFNNFSDWIE